MKKKLPTPVQLPSGSWRVQMMVDGKRISVVDEDPAMAQARAVAMSAGLLEQKKEKAKTGKTLREAIDDYVKMKSGVLSPSTIRGYRTIKEHRFKALMDRPIDKITKADVQKAVSLEAKEVSPKTVYNVYGLIRPVLKENGVDVFGVKLPQKIKPRKRYLQPDDVGKLIEAATGDPCEIQILIAVWLGMRRSEIAGLCWDCVDFEHKTLTVKRRLIAGEDQKFVLREGAKNESSQRVVPCPDYIMDKLKAIYTPGADGLIFHTYPDVIRKHLHKICKEAGITDTTVHGLRHTNAAVMKSLGIDDAHAMARGGWKQESTYKETYSYVFDQEAAKADKKIDQFFQKAQKKK